MRAFLQSEPGKLVRKGGLVKTTGTERGQAAGDRVTHCRHMVARRRMHREITAVKTARATKIAALTFPQPARNISCP